MTTVEQLKRWISKGDITECCHGTKAVERSDEEAIEGRSNAARGQRLRGRGQGGGRGTTNRIQLVAGFLVKFQRAGRKGTLIDGR